MVQAAALKIIDFSAANFLDRRWWLKLRWAIDKAEQLSLLSFLHTQHDQHIAVADYKTDSEQFNHHWDAANDIVKRLYNLNFPWLATAIKEDNSTKYSSMMEEWKRKFGDMNDPEVKAKFNKMAADIKKNLEAKKKAQKPKETTNDKLRRINQQRRQQRTGKNGPSNINDDANAANGGRVKRKPAK